MRETITFNVNYVEENGSHNLNVEVEVRNTLNREQVAEIDRICKEENVNTILAIEDANSNLQAAAILVRSMGWSFTY